MKAIAPMTDEIREAARQSLNGYYLMRGIREQAAGSDEQVLNVLRGIAQQPSQHAQFLGHLKAMRDAVTTQERDDAFRQAMSFFFGVAQYDRRGVTWETPQRLATIARQCAEACEAFMRPAQATVRVHRSGELRLTPLYPRA